jgi:hypothetical protein
LAHLSLFTRPLLQSFQPFQPFGTFLRAHSGPTDFLNSVPTVPIIPVNEKILSGKELEQI